MDHSGHWAGIDTSTRSFAICVVDGEGKLIREAVLPASIVAVQQFLADPANIAEVALETGTVSLHPARMLKQLGYNVAVYSAFSVQRYLSLSVNKTDSNDARGLAEIARLRVGRLKKVFLRSRELAILRMKLVSRERITTMRKLNERALMSILYAHGVRADTKVTSQPALRRIVDDLVAKAEGVYGPSVRDLVMPLVEVSARLRKTELQLENDLKIYGRSNDLCRRLMAIPGVGIITATSFITAVGDPDRFPRSTDIGPYLGLTPRVWETGTFARKRGISKHGSSLTRRHLHLAARSMLRSRADPAIKSWAQSLELRMNRKKAVVALSRKLAVVMLAMWKNGTHFRDHVDTSPPRANNG